MKTKLQILIFLMLFSCLGGGTTSLHATTSEDIPILSNELPSTSYLKREKRSIAATTEASALASPVQGLMSRAGNNWEDPFLPGDGETSNPGNVGAPIGDASWAVIISILFIYILYRGVTTSNRRNNF